MSDIKKQLLQDIDKAVARKQEMKSKAAERHNIDAWVTEYIKNIEEINIIAISDEMSSLMYLVAINTLCDQLRTIDARCQVIVSWIDKEDEKLQVNGVLIKWSKVYQEKFDVEPELFVDITSVLFK